MRRLLILVVVLAIVGMCIGCFRGGNPGESIPTPTPIADGEEPPPANRTWISPGKVVVGSFVYVCPNGHKVTSDKPRDWVYCGTCRLTYGVELSDWRDERFYAGARAEWPITIHNGNNYTTTYDVYLRFPDHVDEDWFKVVETKYEYPECQKLREHNCEADLYEQKWDCPECPEEWTEEECSEFAVLEATCEGCPIQITEVDTRGNQNVRSSGLCLGKPELHFINPEVQDWVIIADSTPILAPYDSTYSTRDILVILTVPFNAHTPDAWEFWIGVMDTSQTGMVRTELCSRWLVNMR